MTWPVVSVLLGVITFGRSELTNEEILRSSLDHFQSNLYKYIAEDNEGKNLVLSPLSAHVAIGLLSMGSEGQTLNELNAALLLPNKTVKLLFDYNYSDGVDKPPRVTEYDIPIYDPTPPTLRIANKIYVKKGQGYELSSPYNETAVNSFRSEVENVDFTKATEAANAMNSWVESKTKNKIKNFIDPTSIREDTHVILVNAIYFKASWEMPFYAPFTKKKKFHINADTTVHVDMMVSIFAQLQTWVYQDATIFILPFHGGDYSMMFAVPMKVDGLKALEEKLELMNLKQVLNNLVGKHVELSLPKFKIETSVNLKHILPKTGISKIFTGSAELTGLLKSCQALVVDDARQKAFIEVDEYGCEAAAATYISSGPISVPLDLTVNVPFYYAIIDGNGNRIFSGRVVK